MAGVWDTVKTPVRKNADNRVIEDFGAEWSRFAQSELESGERQALFDDYFRMFPWNLLPRSAVGADIGCGSGRWALLVASRAGELHCVDASPIALDVARKNLRTQRNVHFHLASVDTMPIADGSLDFAYSLGVLHHVPDTAAAVKSVALKLKKNAPFLLYLYYAFDNRPAWYKLLWRGSDVLRRVISRLPKGVKHVISDAIAVSVYWPLARSGLLLDKLSLLPASWPLSAYRDKTFYSMRTDALDRFGTRLEQRFTRSQIHEMMLAAGLTGITFSEHSPFWCAIGYRT